nr:hypothetical protein [uncultured Desulfobulbus sp.]
MYRLCKLFISDVTAGDNLLRNAFVPINRESGIADHGVLFAANGTCKTTLLSFILNIFSPEQRRFVQHLQSTGDKTLEQYLIPGRPAVVLVDLACNEQPTLFNSAPESHLVLGQLLYRSRGMVDKLDRIFFIAHSPDFFDLLRTTWDNLLEQEQPWRAIRDFVSQHAQQTNVQSEWLTVLERLGLDPWLIDRQIDFARSEGGIKDAFKFRSESDFLNFFLGCVTDLEAAETLRKNIGQSLRKMEDRPRKIAQLETARELKRRLRDYNASARIWRDALDAVDGSKAVLGEAVHLLQQSKTLAEQQMQLREKALQETQKLRATTHKKQEVAQIHVATVERFQLCQAVHQAQEEISRAEQEIQCFKEEQHGLKAADIVAEIRRNRGQLEIKQDVLRQASEELSPLLERIALFSLQYHARLDEDRRSLLALIKQHEAHIAELDSSMKTGEVQLKAYLSKRSALEEQKLELSARIRAAQERRQALPMQEGESPDEARERLQDNLRDMDARLTAVSEQRASLEKKIGSNEEKWRLLQKKQSELNVQHEQARQCQEAEFKQRQRLLASPHLQRIAGRTTFDPTKAELVSRLDDALTRSWEKIEQKKRQQADLTRELERLRGTETLTADEQTRGLLAHYHQQGISPEELKTFPEHLASLYTAPKDIARFIESDPGRFTGLMATSQTVIEKIRALPVPGWLYRPVILSTWGEQEESKPISASVICPADPGVYSKRYLEETRSRLQEQLDKLIVNINLERKQLREMEADSRALHAYRDTYPDDCTVTALSERLQGLEQSLVELQAEITDRENDAQSLRKQKSEQEALHYALTKKRVQIGEHHDQVQAWRKEYESLERWGNQAEKNAAALKKLALSMETEAEKIQRIREEVASLKADIQVSRSQIKGLDERAGEVPKYPEATLNDEQRKTALQMDRESLKQLFEEARDHQRHRADALGVSTVQRELIELEGTVSHQESHLESMLREVTLEPETIEHWVGQSVTQREERRNFLNEKIQETTGAIGTMRGRIEYQNRDIEKLTQTLTQCAALSIKSSIRETDLNDQDLEEMIHLFQQDVQRHGEKLERLDLRTRELEAAVKEQETWRQEVELGLAATQSFTPLWDQQSPRMDWPETLSTAEPQENIEATRTLNAQARQHITAFEQLRYSLESARSQMGTEFEHLRSDLAAERFMHNLPAVIDELLRYDTESLGNQAKELIQRCEEIAQNIEGDLSISQQIMDNLVDMLLSRAKEYHQKLQTAAQQLLPEDVYMYGGRSILRAGTRLDFTRFGADFKRTVENWLHELMQQDRLPEVNQRVGNCLGAELLYQLLRASTGKKDFGIRLLKCDDTGRNYEQVGKDLGSGGEALTTAVLLYTLLTFMRKKRHNLPHGRLPAFLILDNPLGVCNRSDFLDAQLKVAKAMGIQCVYLTGINDRESLGLFELRVAIRKGEKKARIGKRTYTILEIAELNVEHTAIPVLA